MEHRNMKLSHEKQKYRQPTSRNTEVSVTCAMEDSHWDSIICHGTHTQTKKKKTFNNISAMEQNKFNYVQPMSWNTEIYTTYTLERTDIINAMEHKNTYNLLHVSLRLVCWYRCTQRYQHTVFTRSHTKEHTDMYSLCHVSMCPVIGNRRRLQTTTSTQSLHVLMPRQVDVDRLVLVLGTT